MREIDLEIDNVKDLPPAPRVLAQLITLLRQPDVDCSRLVDLIRYDPALTAKVLKVCNSAMFAAANAISDLEEAVTRLGFSQIYIIVASVTCRRSLSVPLPGHGIDPGELWDHSVATAIGAQYLARQTGGDESLAFTGGLLHDIGKLVLSGSLQAKYAELVKVVEGDQMTLLDAEKKLLGMHHAEVGGRLLERWAFPPELVESVAYHHHPGEAKTHRRLAATVYVANMLAYFLGYGYGYQAFALSSRSEALDILELGSDDLPVYMIKTQESYQKVKKLFEDHG